jgi:hypothetical protein
MSETIEIANCGDTPKITDLALDVYGNERPGFQVDAVTEYRQLLDLFHILREAVPDESAKRRSRFNDAYMTSGRERVGDSHIDNLAYQGLAVHQELSETLRVELAIANDHRYVETRGYIDLSQAHNPVTGETEPGRLTIFSLGQLFEGLLPTVHLFHRQSPKPEMWARYSSTVSVLTPIFSGTFAVRRTAKRSMNILNQETA